MSRVSFWQFLLGWRECSGCGGHFKEKDMKVQEYSFGGDIFACDYWCMSCWRSRNEHSS